MGNFPRWKILRRYHTIVMSNTLADKSKKKNQNNGANGKASIDPSEYIRQVRFISFKCIIYSAREQSNGGC